jgi:uncharacterized protein
MDILLIGLGILLIIGGIIGSVLPFLPGPPLSYAGLLMLHFTEDHQFTSRFLIIWAIVTGVTYLIDYVIPIWGTKRFGGSRQGIWGSIIGLVAGIFFFPPFGIIIGPFAGAVIGELVAGKTHSDAFRSGFGSFVGFLLGTLIQLIAAGLMAWHFARELFFS